MDKQKLIEWLESMPWWAELPYAKLEEEIGRLDKAFDWSVLKVVEAREENAELTKRLWDYEHQASDARIRDEK